MKEKPLAGILDLSLLHAGVSAANVVRETTTLAILAEQLGYDRFWVSEHHNNPLLGCASPEVLIAHVASVTKRIKVGSGGVLLSNHSPLHIAENFRMLEALFPGRIELGMGSSPGGDVHTVEALRNHSSSNEIDFESRLYELRGYLQDSNSVKATPVTPGSPSCFLLGSSVTSAQNAGRLQLPYVYAHFLKPLESSQVAVAYHSAPHFESRSFGVAVFLVCADDRATLKRRKAYAEFYLEHFYSADPEKILRTKFMYGNRRSGDEKMNPSLLAGTPAEIRKELTTICGGENPDHVLFIPAGETLEERMEMMGLMAHSPIVDNI